MKIQIVTLNTWDHYGPCEKRWKYLIDESRSLQPDIIFFQEVSRPAFAKQILKCFCNFYCATNYKSGLATFSRFPIIRAHYKKYKTQSPREDHERGLLTTEVAIARKHFILANTHLAWQSKDADVREKQIKEMAKTLRLRKTNSILAGDFNDTPESKPVSLLTKSGWKDLYRTVHPETKGITWDNQNPFIQSHSTKFPDRRIDFIFLDRGFSMICRKKSARVVFNRKNRSGLFPSDHYGVLGQLDIPGSHNRNR